MKYFVAFIMAVMMTVNSISTSSAFWLLTVRVFMRNLPSANLKLFTVS
jgi:hypothetical protein